MPRDELGDNSDMVKGGGDIVSGNKDTLSGSSDVLGADFTPPGNWPNASNTGITVPVSSLTRWDGTYNTFTPGVTIENLEVFGDINTSKADLVIRNCLVHGRIITSEAGTLNCHVYDCEIDGGGTFGVSLILGNGTLAERINMHGHGNGVQVEQNSGTIRDSWIHNLFPGGLPPDDEHTDGIQGGSLMSNFLMDHCSIQPNVSTGTSAINIWNENTPEQAHDITIQNSYLDGRGSAFVCYFPRFTGWSNIYCLNNLMRSSLATGVPRYCDSSFNTTAFTGNIDAETGATISTGQ